MTTFAEPAPWEAVRSALPVRLDNPGDVVLLSPARALASAAVVAPSRDTQRVREVHDCWFTCSADLAERAE